MASLPSLKSIAPTTPWYTHDAKSGAVTVQNAIWHVRGTQPTLELSGSARMALALTEACCETGIGKVFYVHPDRRVPHRDQRGLTKADTAFKGVPGLFYIPVVWSQHGRTTWMEMSALGRLEALTSRYGMVPRQMSVLPIDVELMSEDRPTLNGRKTGTVTILLSPLPYIGPTSAMREACGPVNPETLGFQCAAGWKAFAHWRSMDGLIGVVKVLDQLYREGDDTSYLGSLQKRLIHANMQAAKHGEAYFLRATNDRSEDEGQDSASESDSSP